MISLGNIALSLKDRLLSLKSDYNVYFSLSSSLFGSKSFFRLVLLLTRLFSSSSDVGVKNLANSLTRDGPMHLRGSSWMSCNLSVSESLLLRGALAFSACTWLLDPLSLGRLRGYGGSGIFATGGAETGRGWFCGWLATCFSTAIRCCWSLKLSIWLLVTGWLWRSLVPASRLLKERSISSSSGDVDRDVLAELLVSGLEAFEDGCELLSDDVSDEELLSVPLVLVLSVHELPDGELGKDTEDSLVVVSDTGCELAGWESLDDGCGSLRSECLFVTAVCLIGMSRSGSVTFSLKFLLFLVEVSRPGCLLGGIDTVLVTGLSPNLVILARLLGWTLLSGIGALRHFTMNCKARKPVVRTFLFRSWKDRLWWYITLFLSLATRCSCYFWWDRVFHHHCIRILLRRLLWCLLLFATSFAMAIVAPRGTTSRRLWLLASVRALSRLGCNLWTTDSFEMIDALAPIASFAIRGTVAPLMGLATFATTLAIITAATGPSFR